MTYQDRFSGIARLYGVKAVEIFRQTRIAVIGIGGVGSWVAEALARTGFNHIKLVDLDDICVTNTNRQIHTLDSTVGALKVDAMADRLRGINPEIDVQPVMSFLTQNNLDEILTGVDYVVDAIDSVQVKAALLAHCKRHKLPIVTTGAAGGQIDPTQINVTDINKTYNDPLAKKVRSILRRDYGFSRNQKRTYGIPCVYSTEQLKYPQPDGSVCQQKSFEDGAVRLDCSGGFGASTMVAASFGFVAAAEVAKRLAKKAES